jgi:hypothetical protein
LRKEASRSVDERRSFKRDSSREKKKEERLRDSRGKREENKRWAKLPAFIGGTYEGFISRQA